MHQWLIAGLLMTSVCLPLCSLILQDDLSTEQQLKKGKDLNLDNAVS